MQKKEISFDAAQANLVGHLSAVQKSIEEYEPVWLKFRDSVGALGRIEKAAAKSVPKYSQPKPKRALFRSFLIENISTAAPSPEAKEGFLRR